MLYFKTRGALIDAIVMKIFDDDEAATPPPSPLVPPRLDSVSSSLRSTGIRYKILSHLQYDLLKNCYFILHIYI